MPGPQKPTETVTPESAAAQAQASVTATMQALAAFVSQCQQADRIEKVSQQTGVSLTADAAKDMVADAPPAPAHTPTGGESGNG